MIKKRSFDFALKIILLTQSLKEDKQYLIANRLQVSGQKFLKPEQGKQKRILFLKWRSLPKKQEKPDIG